MDGVRSDFQSMVLDGWAVVEDLSIHPIGTETKHGPITLCPHCLHNGAMQVDHGVSTFYHGSIARRKQTATAVEHEVRMIFHPSPPEELRGPVL